jgi:hypothetical protein
MWLPLVIQGVSKTALQWYSKCYCVESVTKTFTLKGVQTIIHRSALELTLTSTNLNLNLNALYFISTQCKSSSDCAVDRSTRHLFPLIHFSPNGRQFGTPTHISHVVILHNLHFTLIHSPSQKSVLAVSVARMRSRLLILRCLPHAGTDKL